MFLYLFRLSFLLIAVYIFNLYFFVSFYYELMQIIYNVVYLRSYKKANTDRNCPYRLGYINSESLWYLLAAKIRHCGG